FDLSTAELWKYALKNMGKEQALMANFPNNPSLN
ncbi:MAG: hypothetical protein ACI91R_002104, partial [Vicingaceae bacterium]